MIQKPFAIYKQSKVTKNKDVWLVHRRYATAEQAKDAFRELTKKPKKLRFYLYIPLPTVDPTARAIKFKDDLSSHAK